MLQNKYQCSTPCGVRQEEAFKISQQIPILNMRPQNQIGIKLVEAYTVMLHMKYQRSRPYTFRQEVFSMFSQYKPV